MFANNNGSLRSTAPLPLHSGTVKEDMFLFRCTSPIEIYRWHLVDYQTKFQLSRTKKDWNATVNLKQLETKAIIAYNALSDEDKQLLKPEERLNLVCVIE